MGLSNTLFKIWQDVNKCNRQCLIIPSVGGTKGEEDGNQVKKVSGEFGTNFTRDYATWYWNNATENGRKHIYENPQIKSFSSAYLW